LVGNRGFIYKREIKKRIMKISDILEDGQTESAGKINAGMKTTAACWE